MSDTLGRFGAMVKEYERARRGYPSEVFAVIKKRLPSNPHILDIGCGTGISTRQLAKLGSVIGCDPDPIMLRAARRHPKAGSERYVRGSAHKLPFKSATFDAVTAFSSFHWFDDAKSIAEIRRVLKPGGTLFVVNKTGDKSWGEGYRQAIIKSIHRKIAHFKDGKQYTPARSLRKNGFTKIETRRWRKAERYTLTNALEYVQSVSIWNSVPLALRPQALVGLEKYFRELKKRRGAIERKLTVRVVFATK